MEVQRVKAFSLVGPPSTEGQSQELNSPGLKVYVDFPALHCKEIHVGPKHIFWPLILEHLLIALFIWNVE